MYKKITLVAMITVMLSVSIVLAKDIIQWDAYKFDSKILYNGKEVTFNLPIVSINDNAYIPLREAAEKCDMVVNWNDKEKEIILTPKTGETDEKRKCSIFSVFQLPETAKILNCDYRVEDEEEYSAAKISFEPQDLEAVKSSFAGWLEDDGILLPAFNKEYTWWDLTDVNETVCAYYSYKSGVRVKSIPIYAFVTSGEDGRYYLYLVNGI